MIESPYQKNVYNSLQNTLGEQEPSVATPFSFNPQALSFSNQQQEQQPKGSFDLSSLFSNVIPSAIPSNSLMPTIGAVTSGAITGGLQLSGAQKAFDGDKKLNFAEEAALALPTFGLSFVADDLKDLFSGKNEGERRRAAARDWIGANSKLGDEMAFPTFDGASQSFKHGDNENGNLLHEVDFKTPFSSEAVAMVDPLAEVLAGGDAQLRSEIAGDFANAVMGTHLQDPVHVAQNIWEVKQNVLSLLQQFDFTPQQILSRLGELYSEGKIDAQRHAVYQHEIQKLLTNTPKPKTVEQTTSEQPTK